MDQADAVNVTQEGGMFRHVPFFGFQTWNYFFKSFHDSLNLSKKKEVSS